MKLVKWVIFFMFFILLTVALNEIDSSLQHHQNKRLVKDVIIYELFVEDEK